MIELPEGARVFEFDPAKSYIIYVPLGTNVESMVRGGRYTGIHAQIIAVEDPSAIRVEEKCR